MRKIPGLQSIDVSGKRVLMRVDINVPMQNGKVIDTTRIDQIVPEIRLLQECGAKVILMSHLGRPKGQRNQKDSLEPLIAILSRKLGQPVSFAKDVLEQHTEQMVTALEKGQVLLLENLRFYPGEEKNDKAFAQRLAGLADVYVNNAFSVSHRAHASVDAITQFLPSVAGRLLLKEIAALNQITEHPQHPVTAIVGGSKVSTKIGVLNQLLQKIDTLVLAGGIANTFLLAKGYEIGHSLCEPEHVTTANRTLANAKQNGVKLYIPEDAVVVQDLQTFSGQRICRATDIHPNESLLDIGPQTVETIASFLSQSATVLWNGPLGLFEVPPFDQGSLAIAQTIAKLTKEAGLTSIAGGGETVAVLKKAGCLEDLSYVSTAGGAFLEFLEGKSLPGILALQT